MKFKTIVISCLFFLFVLVLNIYFNGKYLNTYPSDIHAWAQSDRYALAKGFVRNDLNFFLPETYTFNKQFPHVYNHTITSVDFPIHDYLVGVAMKISGNTSPIFFRGYVLIYFIIGVFFMFLTIKHFIGDYFLSFLIAISLMCSPVLLYYGIGFLPTIPSLANMFVGLYFFVKSKAIRKQRYFNLAVFFFTLAALSRIPFTIGLISLLGGEFIRIFVRKRTDYQNIATILLGLIIVAGYFAYNVFLRNIYGSMFLASPLPPQSLNEFLQIANDSWAVWGTSYFSFSQWLFIIVIMVLSVTMLISRKVKFRINMMDEYAVFVWIYTIGTVFYSFLMFIQFVNHDYYFLDTFYYPIVMISILAIRQLLSKEYIKYLLSGFLLVIVPFNIYQAKNEQTKRYGEHLFSEGTYQSVNNYSASIDLIDKYDTIGSKRFLTLNSKAPNLPFSIIDRKGYYNIRLDSNYIKESLTWDYDYAIFENHHFLSELYKFYPNIINELSIVESNGIITILKKDKQKKSLIDFYNFSNEDVSLESSILSDSINWTNTSLLIDSSYFELMNSQEFGPTFKMKGIKAKSLLIELKVELKDVSESDEILVVFQTKRREGVDNYQSFKIMTHSDSVNWHHETFHYLASSVLPENEISVYLWNHSKAYLKYKNIELKGYSIKN